MKPLLITIAAIILFTACIRFGYGPERVQGRICPVVSDRMKLAIYNMGPEYDYMYVPYTGTLYVDQGKGWRRLRF